jgi:hypothetical protein
MAAPACIGVAPARDVLIFPLAGLTLGWISPKQTLFCPQFSVLDRVVLVSCFPPMTASRDGCKRYTVGGRQGANEQGEGGPVQR